jgi:hypothetical protein
VKPDKPSPKKKRRIIRDVKFDGRRPYAEMSRQETVIDALMGVRGIQDRAAPTVEEFKAVERTVFLKGLKNWIWHGQSFDVGGERDKLLGIEEPPKSEAERWGVSESMFATMIEAATIRGPSGEPFCSKEEAEIIQAAHVASGIIERLTLKALEGKPEAAFRLACLAANATSRVWWCAERDPVLLEAIQRRASVGGTFPVLVGKHKDWRSKGHVDYWLERLQIGQKAGVNHEGFETHRKPGQRLLVDKWCERLAEIAFNIPRLCGVQVLLWGERGDKPDATWPEWFRRGYDFGNVQTPCDRKQAMEAFEIAWAALMWATNDQPESIPELFEMGRYKEGSSSGERKGIRGAAQNAVQAGIREKLRRVWLARYATGKS